MKQSEFIDTRYQYPGTDTNYRVPCISYYILVTGKLMHISLSSDVSATFTRPPSRFLIRATPHSTALVAVVTCHVVKGSEPHLYAALPAVAMDMAQQVRVWYSTASIRWQLRPRLLVRGRARVRVHRRGCGASFACAQAPVPRVLHPHRLLQRLPAQAPTRRRQG